MRSVFIVAFVLAVASATSAAAVDRLIGGQEASISQYPFMANILQSHDNYFFMSACSGAILNNRAILTTASCWPQVFGFLRIRVGSSNATSGGTVLSVNTVTTLGSFNPLTLESDVAIMKTADDMVFVPNAIMPVGFASFFSVIPDNSLVTIAGWGRTEVGHYSEQLRHAQFRAISNRECDAQSSPDVYVPNNMMCTTGIGGLSVPDVCVGDNGSPVVLNNIVVGLVAQPRCGSGRPSVHTRVSSHAWFIERNLN